MVEIIIKTTTSKLEVTIIIIVACIAMAAIIALIFLLIEGQETLQQLKQGLSYYGQNE